MSTSECGQTSVQVLTLIPQYKRMNFSFIDNEAAGKPKIDPSKAVSLGTNALVRSLKEAL